MIKQVQVWLTWSKAILMIFNTIILVAYNTFFINIFERPRDSTGEIQGGERVHLYS